MIKKSLLIFITISFSLIAQVSSNLNVIFNDTTFQIPAYNHDGTIFLAVKPFAEILGAEIEEEIHQKKITLNFSTGKAIFSSLNPFALIIQNENNDTTVFQLARSAQFMDGLIFVPMQQYIELHNTISENTAIIVNLNRLFIVSGNIKINSILNVTFSENAAEETVKIKLRDKVKIRIENAGDGKYQLKLKNVMLKSGKFSEVKKSRLIKSLILSNNSSDVDVLIKTISENVVLEPFLSPNQTEVDIRIFEREYADLYERESEHFEIIYRINHSHLVNTILASAENALKPLMAFFNYIPDEKIIINTYDVSDYGFGATTTVPQNFIRLEIEPLEPGYELVPYNERFQWLLSHELVHIVVNDHSTGVESFLREIFGKVPPEKIQPVTVFYSILTNYKRYTPRWYQEALAVYIETWFSGGYGRILGSFDEMYFRTIVSKGGEFYNQHNLETIGSHNSILLETLFYIYGARFISYLAIKYSSDDVIKWVRAEPSESYKGIQAKFEDVFKVDFNKAWQDFINYEIEFQNSNLELIEQNDLTNLRRISSETFGWVTQPYFDRYSKEVFFGYHRSHELAEIQSLKLNNVNSNLVASLQTPSMIQVASTAFDEGAGLYFFTTNNNQLFRDIWVVDVNSGDKKLLFENCRVGDLTISPATRDLWGVRVQSGIKTLVVSPYPYNELIPIFSFDVGEDIYQLSIDNKGEKLAAVLHKSNGLQSIIVTDANKLISGGSFEYVTITNNGSPENPSWSFDGNFLFWNAFTNGVSNIYRFNLNTNSVKAITNCITGLFKPIEISEDSLFAFEYSIDGFIPVMFLNNPAEHLAAINYLGQKIIEKNPEVVRWVLPDARTVSDPMEYSKEKEYSGFSNLNIQSFVPVISGFQNQIVFGFFTHISDPLLLHDFTLEFGFSPLNETPSEPLFHTKFIYDYKQIISFEISYNGAEFFDLFNNRKRGMLGQQYKLSHNHYWLYEKPHTIKQASTFTLYRGIEFINDNLVRVSQPDFAVLATNLNSKSLRKSIGSSDYERGTDINYTITVYGTEFEAPQYALNTYLEFGNFTTWLAHHNVLHVKIAGGYLWDNEQLVQARFYFGGFGNRAVDNDEIKQFRRVFRFPGIPIYSLDTDRFIKLMIENGFPPIRISNLELANQFVNHIDFAIYSQGMVTKSIFGNYWIDVGAQMDIKFKHWYNLESTFSAGVAKAWSDNTNDWDWFLSIKLLKD